jgi:hypothetical protein
MVGLNKNMTAVLISFEIVGKAGLWILARQERGGILAPDYII